MADKNKLKGAFDGFLGAKPQTSETAEPTATPTEEAPITRTAGRGRPKKWEGNKSTAGDIRTSLILNEDKYKKIEAIALREGLTKKELLDTALDIIIEGYEKKNGEIILPQKESKDLKSLFI